MTNDTNSTHSTTEQDDDSLPADVRAGLRAATVPLETTDPETDADDLASVGKRLADAAVVGLGETTHGTGEFFQLKHRIMRELVVEHGVRAFAMEANLSEAMALDEYVVHGDGDPSEALAGVYFWTWQTESVLAMVEWLRAFNADRPMANRVRFYGFDAQYTQGAVRGLREHFDAVDAAILERVGADLDVLDDDGVPPTQTDGLDERVATAEDVLPRLREHLDANRAAHVAATSRAAHDRARRYVDVIEQAVAYAGVLDELDDEEADGEGSDDDAMERLMETRDGAMAENVAWIREHADVDTLVVWAHDAHINRVEQARPDGAVTAPSLGRHLADRHGEDYDAVGFSFARGSFQAMSEGDDGEYGLRSHRVDEPVPGTVDAVLDVLDEPLAFVDVRADRANDRIADWLATPRDQFRTGATYDTDDPADQLVTYVHADAFDALCFVAETTRARPLDGVDVGVENGSGGDGSGGDGTDGDTTSGDEIGSDGS